MLHRLPPAGDPPADRSSPVEVAPGADDPSCAEGRSHDDDRSRQPARALMWNLEAGGWTAREAGNLVGLAHGLRPARAGWNEREIEQLCFLRALVETGRLDH